MKWYNYKEREWIDIEKVFSIILIGDQIRFYSSPHQDYYVDFNYNNLEERDAEFEKIKALMGIT